MLFTKEGSFVDCTIEDSKLQKEGQEERDSRSLKGLCLSSMKHCVLQVCLKSVTGGESRKLSRTVIVSLFAFVTTNTSLLSCTFVLAIVKRI